MPGPRAFRRRPLLLCHPVSPHIVGRGLDPSACPFPAGTRSPFRHPVGAGHARPATFPPPAVNPSIAHPFPQTTYPRNPLAAHHPHNLCPPTAATPIYTLSKLHPQTLSKKSKKTCKNLLTKVILLAIIIKLSREPSPRRQPLEPLPTACTPFFEENFFKKLSENLLTNERI